MADDFFSKFKSLIAECVHRNPFDTKYIPKSITGKELISYEKWYPFLNRGRWPLNKDGFIAELKKEKLNELDKFIQENYRSCFLYGLEQIKAIPIKNLESYPNIFRLKQFANLPSNPSNSLIVLLQPLELQLLLCDVIIEKETNQAAVYFTSNNENTNGSKIINLATLAKKVHDIFLAQGSHENTKNNFINFVDISSKFCENFEKLNFESEFAHVHYLKQAENPNDENLRGLKQELPLLITNSINIQEQSFNIQEQSFKRWAALCHTFQKKLSQISNITPEQKTHFSEIFKRGDKDIITHQQEVLEWLGSKAAYPVLKCKNTWPIIKQIRNFILDCWGIRRDDKSFDLSKRSMFASDTHQLALDIAAVIPPKPKA